MADTFRVTSSVNKINKIGVLLKSFELSIIDSRQQEIMHRYEKVYGVTTYFEMNENQPK